MLVELLAWRQRGVASVPPGASGWPPHGDGSRSGCSRGCGGGEQQRCKAGRPRPRSLSTLAAPIHRAAPHRTPAGLALKRGDSMEKNRDVRTSSGTFMARHEDGDGVLAWIEDKIAAVTMIHSGCGGVVRGCRGGGCRGGGGARKMWVLGAVCGCEE